MHSRACSFPEPGKIKVFIRRIFLADDFQKLESPRMLTSHLAGSSRANEKAPDTARSPGAAAFSKTNESEASSWMVRNSFIPRISRARGDSRQWCARPETAFGKVRSSPLRQTQRDSFRTF